MVIKEVPVNDQSGIGTASISCSIGSSMLPSQTSTKVDTKGQSRSLLPPAISSGFKIHCLRTLLVFIKNDAIKTKEFPELSTDQAKFMQLLLGKVDKDNFGRNKAAVTDLYRELVHAVKMNELKYEFRINCNESSGGKKSVVFEKVPVLIPSETAVNSGQTADISKQNPKPNVQITEDPNSDTPKPDAPNPDFSKPDAPRSHGPKIDVLKPDTTKLNGPKIDVLKPDTTKSNGPKIDVLKPDTTKSNGPKMDVLKPDTTKSNGPKIDVLKPDTTKSNGPKIDVLKLDTSKSNGPKIDVLKPDTTKSNGPKMDVLKPDTTKSNGPKIYVLKPDTTKSNGPKIDLLKPDTTKSNGTKIDVPKAGAPETHGPKIDVLKSDTTKSNGTKIDVPKAGAPVSHGPKIDVLKPDTTKSNGRNIDLLKPDIPKSNGPKIDVLKSDAPKAQAPKTSDSGASKTADSRAPTIEPPQPDVAEPWFKKPTPLSRTKQKTNKIKMNIIENTPKIFIKDTLNKILIFLLNDDMEKLVLVPKTKSELKFCRRCIIWCSSSEDLSQFGEEFRELHCRISHLLCQFNVQVTKRCMNAINPITRLKEVSYVKTPKNNVSGSEAKETSDGSGSQSTPKKPKKVNVQNALQLAATDNIKLDKVLNLNQSLRSKKKDKKRKKAEKMKAKKNSSASSSSCSSRDGSRDRLKAVMAAAFVPPGPKVAKRPSSEISQSPRKTSSSWSSVDTLRREKLREAMSVPVQSDKAMRMMLGMGWNGGALGPRGDGITEPLMPALEIPRGAGFGLISHRTQTQNSNPETVPVLKKPKVPNPRPTFAPGSDIVVEKTKALLLEDITFDTIMNTTEPAKFKIKFEPQKPTTSKVELQTQSKFSIGYQKLENDLNLECSTDYKLLVPFRMELLKSVWDLINSDANCKSLKYDRRITKNRKKFVMYTMQTLGAKKDPNLFIKRMFQQEEIAISQQIRNKYIENQIIVEAHIFWDFMSIELIKVPKKFNPPDLLELPEIFNPPTPLENKENTATITDCNQIINAVLENTATITNCNQIINGEDLKSYIFSTNGRTRETLTSLKSMQFKVIFLMHMLKFVKSFNEEYEVTFNKVFAKKEKTYMENVVDQINMRIKFGSSQAEIKLGDIIRQHVKDAFLGIIYDHQHTTITLSKYFRFKRLNRPDNAVRRKAHATVNLDFDFTSETLIEPKLNTGKPFDREIKYDNDKDKYEVFEPTNDDTETDNAQVPTENTTVNVSDDETSEVLPNSNELESYDSDDSSVEDYKNNNTNAKVPKLLPGDEGVNISNFLHLYDKEKTNTARIRNKSIINNDSASNVTKNRNSKNNIGNGNVVIDNNDNQFIDMKRAGGNAQDTQKENNFDSAKAEYVVCVEYKEEKELKSAENSTQIVRKEIYLPENVKEDEKIVANDDKTIAYIIDACKDIGDNILEMNEEVTLNTGDLDPNVIVIEDSDSDNDCTENKAKDKIKNISKKLPLKNFTGETDVIIKDIDAVKTMKIINITEDSMEGIQTEPVHRIVQNDSNIVMNKNKLKVAINPGDPTPVISTGETMAVIDKDESQAVNEIDKSKAVIDIGESKAAVIQGKSTEVINKSEPMAVINQGESNAIINTNDSMAIINLDDAADVITKDVSEVLIIQGESMGVFNTDESSKDREVAQIKQGISINPSDETIVKDDFCDRIKKDNIVLSEEFCNTQSVKSSREQTAGAGSDFRYDKGSEIKNVLIGHTHHPDRMLSKEKIEKIQWHISNCIKLATELPLLKCHGVQNGALFYTCHNKKTYDWLQNTIGVASHIKVFDTKEVNKMALKLCGYFDFDSNYLFKMLEMYNKEISTKEWIVEKTEKKGDNIIFIVKMDKFSIKFIQESDLALFVGIDKVNFSLIWE